MTNVVIFGASRGLGSALAQAVPDAGEKVWCISRSKPSILNLPDGVERVWIEADLSSTGSISTIVSKLAGTPIDILIYNAGIFESNSFAQTDDAEIRAIVDTNLTSLLLAIRHLLGNLRAAANARIILIGSTCGLDNEGSTSIAYVATKFAMRGVGHGLRELVRKDGIAVTVISPGSMATDVSIDKGREAALDLHGRARIPVGDIVDIVRTLRKISVAACVKEIHIPAIADDDV